MALRVCVQSLVFSNRVQLWGKSLSPRSVIRPFSRLHELLSNSSPGSKVLLHFVYKSGTKTSVMATEGESLLDVVINKNLQIDGFGACEGTLACSTCHLLFDDAVYEHMEPVSDEEMDMLDLAYGLSKTSRLGCQVVVASWMNGMTVRVPQGVKDQRVTQKSENKQ
ncbi:ferredoxin 1b [Tachysurus fulvidraco]|uniref:ferredoxin 1b n=1 Tax=Tachysurus fulvidraco TaxID=1234273 RepID=UPI001FF00D54|nr:ferredoxin 1b [Tachysurus fulvidraco]